MMKPKTDRVRLSVDSTGYSPAFTEETYEVLDTLNAQFTVDHDGHVLYLFYSDEEVTWRNSH